jgi:hypothetical protein
VVAGYFDELAQTREMPNRRYDDLKSGRVKPLDAEEFFENLRRREDELLKNRSPRVPSPEPLIPRPQARKFVIHSVVGWR